MELGLYQNQKLSLVITPSLRQAISMLQFSIADLIEFLNEEANENPLLELEQPSFEMSYEAYTMPTKYLSKNNTEGESGNTFDYISKTKEITISDYLLEQIRWENLDEESNEILKYLILNLDENGYLDIEFKELKEKFNVDESTIMLNIKKLQSLEPIGVGARNLSECLLLQVKEKYPNDLILSEIVKDHLPLIAERKWKKLASIVQSSFHEIERCFKIIQKLNPKPGALFSHSVPQYIIPDIIIKEEMGQHIILTNDLLIPKIKLNETYSNLQTNDYELAKYINRQKGHFNWLCKSIEQRKETILKVTHLIIKKQKGFLKHGFRSLKPMTLKEIAEELNIHESTVSRATNNKYVRTPIGTFELKDFFTSKLEKRNGNEVSSMKVKLFLKEIIDQEDKNKPYSDQKIVQLLHNKKGVKVSRRTIAKYRDELNILSSSKRRLII